MTTTEIIQSLKKDEKHWLDLQRESIIKGNLNDYYTRMINYTRARIDQAIICFKNELEVMNEWKSHQYCDCKCDECSFMNNRIQELTNAIKEGEAE